MTIQTVFDLCISVRRACELFGNSEEFALEWKRRYLTLGETIAVELGYGSASEAPSDIDPDTVLGEKAQLEYEELLAWLGVQHPQFKPPTV